MLRLLANRLPMDDGLAARGFHLPSKCSCCLVSNTESLRHLFLEGELATAVWQFFGSVAGLDLSVSHVRVWLMGWCVRPRNFFYFLGLYFSLLGSILVFSLLYEFSGDFYEKI